MRVRCCVIGVPHLDARPVYVRMNYDLCEKRDDNKVKDVGPRARRRGRGRTGVAG